ncbi:putative FK506-binding protein 15 [Penaeus vannamei]|uniref:Putative FK506-binding protein 15 n=1 Tax=Penaeus vannamei TaxID=6689 RepID=A0A423SQ19_PENVA|nr:putative FK506-binding protein 15 [Penaeus vannamei]
MPVDTDEVLSLVVAVCREEEMNVVIKETFLGTLWNLFFKAGPNNYARAGLVERAESDNKPKDKTKRVEVIIEQDLEPAQREELAESVTVAVKDMGFKEMSAHCIEEWSVKRRIIEVVGVCRALGRHKTVDKTQITQDVTVGEGPVLQEGDQAQISFSKWSFISGKRGNQAEETKSAHRVKLKEASSGLECGLLGLQKKSRRLIFLLEKKEKNSVFMYDVSVERIKQKGSDHSGRSTPQVDSHHGHREENDISSSTLDMLPEDSGTSPKEEAHTNTKASLVSRMARVGHPLLPTRPSNIHTPPTDSESEVEEISRRNAKYNSGSISGSIEELAATPAVRPRAPSARSDVSKPEPAPRPPNLVSPQPLVVYQSAAWQQPGMMHAAYPGAGLTTAPQAVPPAPTPAVPDPTLSLLFSESRSQNTDLRISLSKMSDQLDKISSKLEKVEQNVERGQFSNTMIPSSMMAMHPSQAFAPTASCDPQGLLKQITTIVSENDSMKSQLLEKNGKIGELNTSLTQLLQKNQKLLEEKAELLVAKSEQSQQASSSVSISEVITLKEEKASLAAQLALTQQQLSVLKEELNQVKIGKDSQQQEISNLMIQVRQEQNKFQELQDAVQNQRANDNEDLREQLKNAQKENESMKVLFHAAEADKQSLQKELAVMTSKHTSKEEEQVKVSEVEHGKLKNQLEAAELNLQKAEQQIRELEKEKSDWEKHISQLKEEKSGDSDTQQKEIESLHTENALLKKSVEQLQKSSSNPQELVTAVKKVMNTVFKTLKAQFAEEKSYLGSVVMEKLLNVIRDTTLQLLAEVEEKKNSTADAPPISQDSLGNDVGPSNKTSQITGEALENNQTEVNSSLKEEVDHETEKPEPQESKERENYPVSGEEGNPNSLSEEGNEEGSKKNPSDEECLDPGEGRQNEEAQCDSNHRIVNNELHSSISKSCNDSDCNNHKDTEDCSSLGSRRRNEESSIDMNEFEEEADKLPEDKNVRQRIPVIDMNNTEARTCTTEKSDSSRDSSLERVWRPQPPPPPLLSDEEEEDDWLS